MALYGSVVTDRGRVLIAKLLAGDEMTITKVMVGKGKMSGTPTREELAALPDLIDPVAEAASTVPVVTGGVAHFKVQYSSNMNGGLDAGFWLSEFGVFADDPDEGEILLYYGTLGDRPQWVSPYSETEAPDVRMFQVNLAVGTDVGITVDYHCDAWMTSEEVSEYCRITVLPELLEEAGNLIRAHNVSPTAHEDIRSLIASLRSRVRLLEIETSGGSGNSFSVTFETLDDVILTGVWNEDAEQIEF